MQQKTSWKGSENRDEPGPFGPNMARPGTLSNAMWPWIWPMLRYIYEIHHGRIYISDIGQIRGQISQKRKDG